MKKWLFLATLAGMFQPLLVIAQDFQLSVATVPALPNTAYSESVFYDVIGQFVYYAGSTTVPFDGQTFNGGPADAFVTKHYLNGSRVWSRLVGGTDFEIFQKLLQNPLSSDLFLIGYTGSPVVDGQTGSGFSDILLVKYAQNGTKLFTRVFGTNTYDSAFDAIIDTETQQLVVGGQYNAFIAITVQDIRNGSMLKLLPFPVGESAYGITPASSKSDCFMTGYTTITFDNQSAISGYSDIFVSKVNFRNGTRYWTRIWGSDTFDFALDVQFDPSSQRLFVAGYTYGSVNGQPILGYTDAYLICASANGTLLWTNQAGTDFNDGFNSIDIHQPTGALFVVGHFGGTYPGKTYGTTAGAVATFAQNGTLRQIQFPNMNSDYHDISLGSYSSLAFVADYLGFLVAVNVSLPGIPTSTALPLVSTPIYSAMATETLTDFVSTSTPMPDTCSDCSATATAKDEVVVTDQSSGSTLPFYVIYAALAAAALVGLISGCFMYRAKHAKSEKSVDTSTATASDTTAYSQMTATGAHPTSMTTMMRTAIELSLPGFLRFKNGTAFRILVRIAKGGGGSVFMGDALDPELKRYGPTIIIKTVGKGEGALLDNLTVHQTELFKQEVSIMHYFREEKYIAKLLGWSDAPACLLMKLYPRGSLDKWILASAYKSKVDVLRFMQDISNGVLAMHSAGFVHCDLKPQNVLVDTDEKGQAFCCLTDFGITQIVDDTSLLVKEFAVANIRGLSVPYAAPEVFKRFRAQRAPETSQIAFKIDLYSLGMIMLELFPGHALWATGEK